MDLPTSLVLGEKDCTFKDVVDIFCNTTNSAEVFNGWRNVARELEINSGQIKKLNRDILLDKLTVEDVLHEILEAWKSEKGKNATLKNLLQHLEKVKLKNVAEDLRKLFSGEGRVLEDKPTFKTTLPKMSTYYIPRTLITRNMIDAKVFSSTCQDVFVVHGGGMDRYRLGQLAKKELTDISSNQVRKDELSVRFILLERVGDWVLLCAKTTNSIHLLRHHEGRFQWICTKGDISALQKALDEKNQIELGEQKFIDEIETDLQFQTNTPICISDSPGMGKSLLLANIGRHLQQRYPTRCIAFIVISEFVVKVKALLTKFRNKEKAIVEALLQLLCETNNAREQLVQKMTTPTENPSTKVELMFDGYDEVSTKNFATAQECLQILKTDFNSTVRLWVTTRPQHLHKLEECFSVLGYNIHAFQEKHQIDFLTAYWNREETNLDWQKLQTFSKNCLGTLKKKLNKKDEDIAAIPLQCMMIAEVYSQEAHRFCDSSNKRLENWTEGSPCIDIKSVADLYEKMILHKITKFIDTYPLVPEEVNCILPWHMYLALELIFPSHVHEFKETLQIESGLTLEYLLNVGILEKRGTTTKEAARFIHRTFAEYLAARYFVSTEITHSTTGTKNSSGKLLNFLLQHALECSLEKRRGATSHYKWLFKLPVFCNFFDALLQSRSHISNENCVSLESTKYIKDVIFASIHSDFGNILIFLRSLKYPESFCINNILYFNSGILIDATRSAALDLLKFLLQNFEHKPLTKIEEVSKLPTPLHTAVRRGSYSIFEYVLKEHGFEELVEKDEDERLRDLVYWAVYETTHCHVEEIEDRAQIVAALCDLNRKIVNYRKMLDFSHSEPPLLTPSVHILLRKKLIESGADLYAVGRSGETILHRASHYLSRTDYYDLLQFILQFTSKATFTSLLQKRDDKDKTCLHTIAFCGLATLDILNLILSNGVDINTSDRKGRTCLFYSVNWNNEDQTIPIVKLLLEKGADHTREDSNGESILHHSTRQERIDCLQFFLEEKNMNVNQVNKYGETPLFIVLQNTFHALETVQFLLERGADYKILNSNQQNLLHYSVKYDHLECLELFLNLGGLDINQADAKGNTPLSVAVGSKSVGMIMPLLNKGADYTILNNEGNNVLHHLAKMGKGRVSYFSLFAELPSFDVNTRNSRNNTPLHIVMQNIRNYRNDDDTSTLVDSVEDLRRFGADVNAKNDDGETPMDIYLRVTNPVYQLLFLTEYITIRGLLRNSETGSLVDDFVKGCLII